ncbi:hypothetical protein [Cardinium endosymbiont of Sogatella furcifera]|uniref:hypothetical protein n=1 Tax=Cardinium endosymbiont of Sogatella furcifera TaxID=650378 RepID=UPI0013B3FC06|nr:hypothetical protein [Cardinium endosymbiont of Sogatella furcifera]
MIMIMIRLIKINLLLILSYTTSSCSHLTEPILVNIKRTWGMRKHTPPPQAINHYNPLKAIRDTVHKIIPSVIPNLRQTYIRQINQTQPREDRLLPSSIHPSLKDINQEQPRGNRLPTSSIHPSPRDEASMDHLKWLIAIHSDEIK